MISKFRQQKTREGGEGYHIAARGGGEGGEDRQRKAINFNGLWYAPWLLNPKAKHMERKRKPLFVTRDFGGGYRLVKGSMTT